MTNKASTSHGPTQSGLYSSLSCPLSSEHLLFMDSRRFTAAEKGKGQLQQHHEQPSKRIRAPEIDTSALIMENNLTLIGRVSNPREQPIRPLISSLPWKWSLKGTVVGADLGQNCFQFRFELEEDLLNVLANRPYHYAHWMLMLQRWEPTLSPLFPSQIPFWIRLHGLPLHYWHEKMIYNIGQGLGVLEDYHISKISTKIRVSVDGLQPITKTAIIEFGSGDELPVTLDYDGLENHCSHCNCLDHEVRHCPMKLSAKGTAMGSSSREEADQSYHQHSSPLLRRTSSTYEHHQHSCHGIFI